MEGVQPLVIITGALDDMVLPIPAGRVSSEAAGLEPQELLDSTHGSGHVGLIGISARVWEVAQGLVANGPGMVGHRLGPMPEVMQQSGGMGLRSTWAK